MNLPALSLAVTGRQVVVAAALSSWLETLWGSNWAASPPTEDAHPSPPACSLLTCPQETGPGVQEEDKDPCSMLCNCEKLEATRVLIKGILGS